MRGNVAPGWIGVGSCWVGGDFGAYDGSDVVGSAILAGPAPGEFEFAIDDVRLTR